MRCESLSRGERLRLAAGTGDSNGAGGAVDDDRVVDVVVDDVRRWCRYIRRRIIIGWHRNEVGNW